MKERKLKEEYTLQTVMDEKGREKQIPVYRGNYHRLKSGKKPRTAAISLLPFFLLYLVPVLAYLFSASPSTYCMYVLLPAICSLLPASYGAAGLFRLYKAPESMTGVQKETGIARVVKSSFGCTVLSFASLAGNLVFLLLSPQSRSLEWQNPILFAAASAGALLLFLKSRKELPSPSERIVP